MESAASRREPGSPRPHRTVGFWSATALVVASMLGTGVFTTSGFLLADLQSPWRVLAAWVVGGIVATAGAMCYGALARRIPESGGEYLFLTRTLHPAAGCVAGWVSMLVGFSAPLAAAANAFGEYTKDWFAGAPAVVSGTVLLGLFSGIHAWNVRHGAAVQNVAVCVKVVLIAMLIGFGAARIRIEPVEVDAFSLPAFALSLVWVSFSYSGWNAVIYLAGEVTDPERTLPRSLLAGTLVVTVIYLALNAVFVLAVPGSVIAGKLEVGRLVAEHLGGLRWADGATVLIVLALMTSVSSLIMTGPRVYARMAADGYLPWWMRQGAGPPRAAVLFQFAVALVMLWTASYQTLLTFIGFTLSLSTAATVLGLVILRVRLGSRLWVPGWPWLPVGFILAVLAMTSMSIARAPGPSAAGFAVLGLGWLFWRLGQRRRLDSGSDPPSTVGRD